MREKVKYAHYLLIILKMSHSIELKWELGDQKLEFGKYLTDHIVILNENISIEACLLYTSPSPRD